MITVIIPAQGEGEGGRLNRTIDNIITTASIRPQVIVIDNGGHGDIDPRAEVITPGRNVGERVAMNLAAPRATNQFLLRIVAHCDFQPNGWDVMLAEVTGAKDVTMAVLTALRMPWDHAPQAEKDKWLAAKRTREQWHDWERLKGHWYGLTKLIVNDAGGLEAKWYGANRDHIHYHGIQPTMAATGCAMMIRKKFYDEIGGADESLPPMGAIGEEFAIKTWAHGGKCQAHMDVTVGHVFGTGGYDTGNVTIAQQMLMEKWGSCYPEVAAKFPQFLDAKLRPTHKEKVERTVIVDRVDHEDTTSGGKLLRRKVLKFRYIWLEHEHPGEEKWTDQQIELKYRTSAVKVGEQILYANEAGELMPEQQEVAV